MLELNENIKETLRARDMTQKQLASYLGMSECSLSRYLKGTRMPRPEDAQKIADFLGVYPKEWFPYPEEEDEGVVFRCGYGERGTGE